MKTQPNPKRKRNMEIGYFALQQNKPFIIPDKETLKFARDDRTEILWHSQGTIEINDILLYAGRCGQRIGIKQLAGLDQSVQEQDGDLEVIICRYGDHNFLPFYKKLGSVQEENQEELDTIYSNEQIQLRLKQSENHVPAKAEVQVNGASLAMPMGEAGCLLAVRQGKIQYFSKSEDTVEDLRAILTCRQYGSYLGVAESIELEAFFSKDLADQITAMTEKGRPRFFDFQGKPAVLVMEDQGTLLPGWDLFSIGDEVCYLENIRKRTAIYDQLYFDNEIKIGKDELSCEARLKGSGQNIEEINKKLDKVCRKNVTIVLTGESGTGKTFLANKIHQNSRRAEGPFVNANCAAIAYNLIESELFGYEEGAFTGARKGGKLGYFEMARGGTLFLDEISELPFLLQGKLLEVLQEGTFYRVGGTKKISADIRLIVATNKNLEKMVKEGRFRKDLYYRINVFPIHLPPLRERIDDLYSIIGDTLPSICQRLETDTLMLTSQAFEKMRAYSWPGNIRELENILEKAVVMADEHFIREEDIVLDNSVDGISCPSTLKEKLAAYEKEIIQAAFIRFNGNRKQMADFLGISKTNLFDKVHKYGIGEAREGEDM